MDEKKIYTDELGTVSISTPEGYRNVVIAAARVKSSFGLEQNVSISGGRTTSRLRLSLYARQNAKNVAYVFGEEAAQAVNDDYVNYEVTYWGAAAERMAKRRLRKGQLVVIAGTVSTDPSRILFERRAKDGKTYRQIQITGGNFLYAENIQLTPYDFAAGSAANDSDKKAAEADVEKAKAVRQRKLSGMPELSLAAGSAYREKESTIKDTRPKPPKQNILPGTDLGVVTLDDDLDIFDEDLRLPY